MLSLVIRIAVLAVKLHGYEVSDWALDNRRDSGAESVGACNPDSSDADCYLVGPDWLADKLD